MEAAREMFWNTFFGPAVYLVALVAIVAVVYLAYRRYRMWRRGQPDNRLYDLSRRIWSFAAFAVIDAMAHRRILRNPYSGVMHLLIFVGAIILLIGTILEPLSHYFFHFLVGPAYLWMSLFLDIAGVLILAGVAMAFLRRYIEKPARLDTVFDDAYVLSLIVLMVITGYALEGMRMAETEVQAHPDWAVWSPVGLLIANGLGGLSESARLVSYKAIWWFHALLFFGGAVYAGITFSKFSHILMAPFNAFLRSLRPRGVPSKVDVMNAEHFGVSKIQDFTWKNLVDLDTCTRCGRCQDNCPAYLTGKALSPKTLVQNLKAHMVASGVPALTAVAGEAQTAGGNGNSEKTGPALIGAVVKEEELWDCTTCGACEEACPVFVEHTDKIINMRRNLVLEQATMPKTVQAALVNTQQRGHPWKGTTLTRTDWMTGIEVERAVEGGGPGLLFWVGCTGALVERNVKATAAFARTLKAAGVKFSVLGEMESCCGHFARRLGDEYLFQTQVEKNVELLKSRNVKTIVTACPHCYHTLKNEYPQFGGRFKVLHHTEAIFDLLKKGKLQLNKTERKAVTYSDPCYLGRYNGVYAAPRSALKALNLKVAEMTHNKSGGLCCGSGGGRMWIEEPPTQRVNQLRTKEAIQTGVDTIATACPFCLQMFDDAIKSLGKEETLKVIDLAELVQNAITPPPPAAKGAPAEPPVRETAAAGRASAHLS